MPPFSESFQRKPLGDMPPAVEAALWRGTQLGSPLHAVISSGFSALDQHLPGGGWPCHSLTEILMPQFATLEWRLLANLLRHACAQGKTIAVVAPPKAPHLPGLRHEGVEDKHLLWIQAESTAQRLWALEQLIKSNACGVLIGWLGQVRQDQVRRLQVLSASCHAPVFLCRPSSAAQESSAAPLRLHATPGPNWELFINIIKRKGPQLERTLCLESMPGGLGSIMTPRLRHPSRLMTQEVHDAVVRLAPELRRSPSLSH